MAESNVSDKMKDHFNLATNIKIKLIKNSIWTTDNVKNCLLSMMDTEQVQILSPVALILKLKNQAVINNLNPDVYYTIAQSFCPLLQPKYFTKRENQYIQEIGPVQVMTMMFSLLPMPAIGCLGVRLL